MMLMAIKDKLVSNTFYLTLNWFFVTLASMGFWLILGKTLPPASYGNVALFFQLATILSSVSVLGMHLASSRLIPGMLQDGRMDKVQGIIMFAFKWSTAAALTIALGMFALTDQLTAVFKIDRTVLWMAAVLVVLMSVTNMFEYVYRGFQKMKKLMVTNFIGGASKIALALAFAYMGLGYFGGMLAIFVSYVALVVSRLERKMFQLSKSSSVDVKTVLSFSIPALVVYMFSALLNESQYIMLSSMKTAELTGIFAVGNKVASIIPIIPIILFSSMAPIVSGLSSDRNPKSRQFYLIKVIFRYTLLFILPLTAFLMVFSKYAVLLFSGIEYIAATDILVVLTLASAFYGMSSFFLSNLYSIGDSKRYMNAQVISSLVYLLISIPMTYYYSDMGLAFAYLLSNVLLFMVSLRYLEDHGRVLPPARDIAKMAVGIIVSFAFILAAKPLVDNFMLAGAVSAAGAALYMLVMLPMNFYIKEDLLMLDTVGKSIPRTKPVMSFVRGVLSGFVKRSYTELQ